MIALTLERAAHESGFKHFGFVDLDLAEKDLARWHAHYSEWIASQYHGEMAYLERGQERRGNPRTLLKEAESLFCVAIPYSARTLGSVDARTGPRYARYIRGTDYHHDIKVQLETFVEKIKSALPNVQAKVCVDTSAVLERFWAWATGLGWIGKNGLLIHPQMGSYMLLGEVLFNFKTGRGPKVLPDYCGSCTRCLEGCPTQALVAPRQLDSRQCISYWTLEKRGPLDLSPTQETALSNWVAGCDLCQEVCPFNSKAAKRDEETPTLEYTWPVTWREHFEETEAEYRARVSNSSLSRIKYADFRRNLENAYRNSGSISEQN